jgi:simple sugar transport system permease protein
MGLGLAIGFRSALFNIGGQGQIIVGGIFASYVGFAFDLPPVIHLIAAIIAAVIGGMLWGFIPGILKAKTGANEVIVTIMLNSVALYLISWVLTQPAFQRVGENRPITPVMKDTALYPIIKIGEIQLSFAFFLAVGAVFLTWWLLERSTLGFKLRATGLNPDAAKSAGINASMMSAWALMISGGFAGLAASSAVLIPATGMGSGVASSYGFDAIMVALLGRSKPLGTFLSALLLGAFRSGGYLMQATTSTPIDVVSVIQAVVVMFIAAPPLIRAIFRLPDPEKLALRKTAKEVA